MIDEVEEYDLSTMSREELSDLKLILIEEIQDIKLQRQRAEAQKEQGWSPETTNWYSRSGMALRHKRIFFQQIIEELTQRNLADPAYTPTKLLRDKFNRHFHAAAKEGLPAEVFEALVEETKRRVENEKS